MYISKQTAPSEFMQRYEAIKSGREKLDTVAKLKDFWLFAVEQGWKSYEMREYVAELTTEINFMIQSPIRELIFAPGPLWMELMQFEVCSVLRSSDNIVDEKEADSEWLFLEYLVKGINPSQYDR